jgi:hypothetical protein
MSIGVQSPLWGFSSLPAPFPLRGGAGPGYNFAMTRPLLLTAGLALASSALGAQSTAPWELSGHVGAGFRSERGHLLGGARFAAALSKPLGASERRFELGLGYAQITAHEGPTGDGANIKENSVESSVMLELPIVAAGKLRLAGALGPALAYSMGCTSGGSYAGDRAGYGNAPCTNAFAEKGKVRVGGNGRLAMELRGNRASLILGALGGVGTVAAGDSFAWGGFVGFRAPLR